MRKPKELTITKTKHDEMERMLTAKVERVIERAKKAEKELDEERAKVHVLKETLLNFFQVVEHKAPNGRGTISVNGGVPR